MIPCQSKCGVAMSSKYLAYVHRQRNGLQCSKEMTKVDWTITVRHLDNLKVNWTELCRKKGSNRDKVDISGN